MLEEGVSAKHILALILEPMYNHNPFFTLFYNPFTTPPRPEVAEKPYYNYIHQVALLLDMVPRRKVRVLIGDEVGLGKTVEAIRIAKYLGLLGEARRILVLAPRSLIKQWIVHEIRDLLYIPGRVKRLTKKTFEPVKTMIESSTISGEPLLILASIDLVKKGALDEHKGGFYKPYYELISSTEWDLIIVDEAHQLNFMSPRKTLRVRRLTPLCEKAKHLILLSATPSRGTHRDLLLRVSLLIPEHRAMLKRLLKDSFSRRIFYDHAYNQVIYRRTKEQVNTLENGRVFTDIYGFMVLIKLGENAKLYNELGFVVANVLRQLDTRAQGLLKVIVLKRAMSSPYAFLKTFAKVIRSASESKIPSKAAPSITDKLLEKRVDEVVEYSIRSIVKYLSPSVVENALRLLADFTDLYNKGDPVIQALAYLLYSVVEDSKELPKELIGDYLIFTEYLDTVEYIFKKLLEFFRSKGFQEAVEEREVMIIEAVNKLVERGFIGGRTKKYVDKLLESTRLFERNGKYVFIVKLSSANQEIVHLIPDVLEAVARVSNKKVLNILISTDIASEGLNLHQFNIIVNYDVPWSPVRREQRIGRVHRLRQVRNCTVLDFVRDVRVDYEFYTKLILKLLEMAEQRLATKPISGVFELYLIKKAGSGESIFVVSEKSVGLLLAEYYEKYYIGEAGSNLDSMYRELLSKLSEYRELYEDLSPRYEELEALKEYVKDFTGCENMYYFESVIQKLYETLYGVGTRDVSKILVEMFDDVVMKHPLGTSSRAVLVVNDPDIEEGYLGVIELVANGKVRYSTPLMVLRMRGEWKILHGLQVLDWVISTMREKGFVVLESEVPTSEEEYKLFSDLAYKYSTRLNTWIMERLISREAKLAEITGIRLKNTALLKYRVKPPIIKVVKGLVSVEDYKRVISELPEEVKNWMEEVSVNLVEKLFNRKGCNTIEKNIGIPKPYDLLLKCPENGSHRIIKVEVKSHLKKDFIAVLSPSETMEAEKDPGNYIVCNVSGLKNKDESTWSIICGTYSKIPVRKVKEEYAVLDFTKLLT